MLSVMSMESGGDSHPVDPGSISDEDLLALFQPNLDNDSPASNLDYFSDLADLAQSSAPLNEGERQTSAAPVYPGEHQDSLWPDSKYNQSFNRSWSPYLNGIEDISDESSDSTDMPPASVFHPEQDMHISNQNSPFSSAAMNVDQDITNLPNIQVPVLLRNSEEHSNSSQLDKGLEFPSSTVSLLPTSHQSQNEFFPNSSQSSGFSSSGNNELSRYWDPHLSGLLDEEGEVFKSSMKAVDLSVSGRTDFSNHSSEIPFGKEFIGKFESEIVNVKGKISSGEIVSLVRASSMFDPYGIQVENRFGIIIGSIKGKHAVVLSHILDKSLAIIKGKVSVTPRNIFSFPLTINLWGDLDKMGQVLDYLKANDIPVESQFRMDNTQNQPTSSLFPMDYGHVLSSRTYVSPIEMENELDEMFKTLDEGDKVTEADPALAVRTPMYPHQKQALNWMMCKENKDTLPPFWNKRGDLYVNTLTKERTVKKPDSIHGGILADDMGLGKTLEMISLIVTNFVKGKPLAEPCSKVTRDHFGSVGKMSKSTSFSRIKQESDSKSSLDSSSNSPSPHRLILPSHPSTASVDIISECNNFHALNNVAVKMEDQDSLSSGFETSRSTDLTTEVLERKPIPPLVLKRSVSRRSSKRSIWCVDSDDEDIEDLSLCLGNEFKGKGVGKKSKNQESSEVAVLVAMNSSQNCSPGELQQPVDYKDVPVGDLHVQNNVIDGPHLTRNKTEYPEKKLLEQVTEHGNSLEEAIDVDALPDNANTVPNNSQDVIMVSEDLQVVKPEPNDYSETKVQEAAIVISDSEDELPDIVSPLIKKKLAIKKLSQKVNAYVDKETGRTCTNSPRGTLIICPLSVISNWVDQFEEHIADNVLINLHVYYGQKRTLDVEFLKGQDVVVTTYSTLMSDFKRGDSSPLHQVEWLRVVLDEGHIIRNPAAQQTKAIFKLEAERRWVLTGTPIQNSLKDLWSLINFLKVEPFTEKHFWNRIIAVPMIKHEPQAVRRVAHLVRNLALRRTKNQQLNGKPILSLPGRHVYLEKITLSPEERSVYDAVQNRSQDIFGDFCDDGTLLNHYGTILTLLLRLRQLCCHSLLVRKTLAKNKNPDAVLDDILHSDNAISEGDKGDRQKLIAQLMAVLESGSDEECSICLESLKEPIITSCAHVYCRKCIEHVIETNLNEARCPMCRSLVEKNELYGVPENAENVNGNQESLEIAPNEWKSSAKVDALMKALHELRLSDPNVKSVIVSQFTALLTLLETPLEEQGFKFARLDGSMRAGDRSAAVHQFSDKSPGSPTIFLLSLKAGGVGINLTAASRVFLMDPAWNPAAEDQCFDRCHRLGQTSDVIITKFVIEDSIEERMLELQDKKRQLINGVLDKKLSADQRRDIRINEIRTLLNL
ncbi:unnamed protein product [Lymnaea stagnalis]|uniref:Helicase-like transcription factor CHR28 n=1 Tax=Lymnaea stagnalis TaxID=6523 RepID=A0AAV2I5U5_LYMST